MSTTTKLMTAEELLALPRGEFRCELINGELIKLPLAGQQHGKIVARVAAHLGSHIEANDLGDVYAAETGFVLRRDPDLVRAPDAAFVRKERVEEVGDADGYFPGAPDLAIKVVNPGDTAYEVEEKVQTWFEYGTRGVWIMYPKTRTIVVHNSRNEVTRLTEHDTLDGGEVVPGFRIKVADLFA